MLSAIKFWVWLSTVSDPYAAWQLYQHFGSPESAFYADEDALREVPGLNQKQLAALRSPTLSGAERVLSDCQRLGVHISTWQDADYPERLRSIPAPPLVLYFLGRPLHLEEECVIAMAGTRRCSSYGQAMAARFAGSLTRCGALVLTGMASGCDLAALNGALQADGPVAVLLPGGVDVPFVENRYYRRLYDTVSKQGTLISTYPPGTPNDHRNFLYRNPVLTGLSSATLVIEAAERSGTLNVAARAQEQQRTLYSIPANLDSPTAAGTNALICSGHALPVSSAEEILLPFYGAFPQLRLDSRRIPPRKAAGTPEKPRPEPVFRSNFPPKAPAKNKKGVDSGAKSDYIDLQAASTDFTDDELSLLAALQSDRKTAEDLTAETEIPSSRALAALTTLTLRGYLKELAGGFFQRVNPPS